MTAMQVVIAREATELARRVLAGDELTPEQRRTAEILLRSVVRYASREEREDPGPELAQIIDALAYLSGMFQAVAVGGAA